MGTVIRLDFYRYVALVHFFPHLLLLKYLSSTNTLQCTVCQIPQWIFFLICGIARSLNLRLTFDVLLQHTRVFPLNWEDADMLFAGALV